MTTETITKPSIADLEEAVSKARETLTEAGAKAAEAVTAIMAVQPIDFVALGAASAPVESATLALKRAENTLSEAKAADRWENSTELRQPILDALRAETVTNPLVLQATGVNGSITYRDAVPADGDKPGTPAGYVVTLSPVFPAFDMESIKASVLAAIDSDKLHASEITDLAVEVNIEKGIVALTPRSASTSTGKPRAASTGNATGARGGTREFIYNGKAMGATEFLTAVEASGHSIATERATGFNTALRSEAKNGLSNLARQVADHLNVTYRTKDA